MPTYPIQIGGKTYPIEAPDLDTALATLQEFKPDIMPPAPVTLGGLAEQGLASVGTGAAYLAGLPGTIRDATGELINKGTAAAFRGITGREADPHAGMTPEGKPGEGFWGGTFERMMARRDPEDDKKFEDALRREGKFGNFLADIGGGRVRGGIGSGAQLAGALSKMTGGFTDRQPQNVPEEYARTIGEFLPAALATGGASLSSLLYGAVAPAVGSETAGQLVRNYGPDRPEWMPDWVPKDMGETIARIGGALVAPAALQKVQRAITPHPAKAPRLDAAKKFDAEGIPYSAGQKTGNVDVRLTESEVGGQKFADLVDDQVEKFNRAALRRLGEDAPYATPEVIESAATRGSKMFDALKQNSLALDNQLTRDLGKTIRSYTDKVGSTARAPIVENVITDIRDIAAKGGRMTGEQYQSMITRLREAGQGATGDTAVVTRALRDNLDDAMERSIAANNPADLGKWRKARKFYSDLRSIEDTVATGARGNEGVINPTKLGQTVASGKGKRVIAQGKDDLGELARAGKTLMKDLPTSMTAGRLARRYGGPTAAGAGLGATLGTMVGGPVGGAIGGVTGGASAAALRKLFSNTYMSPLIQKYLGNQLLPEAPALLTPGAGGSGGLLRLLEQGSSASRAGKQGRLKRKAK